MPYATPEHQTWVARFTNGTVAPAPGDDGLQAEFLRVAREEEERKLKATYLAEVRDRVAKKKADLRTAFVFEVKVEGKRISSLGKDGDQTQTFDYREIGKRVDEAVSMSQMKLMIEAQDFLTATEAYLRQPRRLVPGLEDKPLFADAEVTAEVFTPLVREQIIPETFVHDRVSEVQGMLDETNKIYLEQLEQYKEEPSSEVAEMLKTGSAAVSQLTQAVVTLELPEAAEHINNFIALGQAVLNTGVDSVEAVRQQSVAGTASVLSSIGGIVSTAVGGGVIGKALQIGFKGAGSAVSIASHLTSEPPDTDAFFADLVGVVDIGFSTAATAVGKGTAQRRIQEVAPCVKLMLSTLLSAKKKNLLEQIRKGEWQQVASFVANASAKAVSTALSIASTEDQVDPTAKLKEVDDRLEKAEDGEDKEKLKQEKEKLEKELEEMAEKMEVAKEGLDEAAERFAGLAESKEAAEEQLAKLEEAAKAQQERELEAEGDALEQRLQKEQEEHRASLEALGKVQPDDNDMKSIAHLIEKMQRDRAIMQTALGLAGASVSVLSAFFAPLAGTVTLVQFVGNLQAAAERAMAMRKWMAAQGDAVAAVSPYQTTVANFVKNQAEQFSHLAIKAALNLVKAATQFAAAGGIFTAHVAKVAESAVGLAETAEELIYKIYQKKQVEKAWDLTREALSDPQNRRLGLMARGLNPTLAKYTIAWGAVVKRDTIAVTAMARIGLDRETLARRDSGVAQVKQFLDALYVDDQTVMGEFVGKDWAQGKPPAPALTVRAWLATVTCASDNGKVSASDHAAIVRAMKQVQADLDEYAQAKKAKTLSLDMIDRHVLAVTRLQSALETYDPKLIDGKPATEMKRLSEGYTRLLDAQRVPLMQAAIELDATVTA